jgi:hypothetical protein
MATFTSCSDEMSCTSDESIIFYNITPKDKNSVYEETIYSKGFMFEDHEDILDVTLVVSKTWRNGKFVVELNKKQIDEIIKLDDIKINDYGAMIDCTDDLYEQQIMIRNLDKYPEHIQTKIQEDVYGDLEHDITFDEGDLVDKYGWDLDDTIYSISGGVVIMKQNDDGSEELDDDEFRCEECETVQGLNNCEMCDAENVCEECYGQGGDYGRNEIWVCNDCLPVCLECNKKLYSACDHCCGKGRSDITDDEDDEDDKDDENNQESAYYNIYRCKHCDASTSSDDPDCHICNKEFCMMLVQIQHTSYRNSKDEVKDKQEQTENKKEEENQKKPWPTFSPLTEAQLEAKRQKKMWDVGDY